MSFSVARYIASATRASINAHRMAARADIPSFYPRIRKRAFAVMVQTVKYNTLDTQLLFEEENVRGYKAEHYYPVNIGDTFHDRYKVIGRLGYGTASTVWLCRDFSSERDYIAFKVYINKSKVHRELPIYKRINSLASEHQRSCHVRQQLDSFELTGPHGKHVCLVHEALGMNLEELQDLIPGGLFEPDLVRQILRSILRALHFLHGEARVIHTG